MADDRYTLLDVAGLSKSPAEAKKWWKNRSHSGAWPLGRTLRLDASATRPTEKLPSFIYQVTLGDIQQLCKYTRRVRHACGDVSHVDAAVGDYDNVKAQATIICKSILSLPPHQGGQLLVSSDGTTQTRFDGRRNSSYIRAYSGLSTGSAAGLATSPEDQLEALRGWEDCLELLHDTLVGSLQDTYNEYEINPTPEGFRKICADKTARTHAIERMRTGHSDFKSSFIGPDFFSKYESRLQSYEGVQRDLAEMRGLLHAGESGISPDRTLIELTISAMGDTMLEFANTEERNASVYRFRVSSHVLGETASPIFTQIFKPGSRFTPGVEDSQALPPPPVRYHCRDGSEVKLYRMPQVEVNAEHALEILLHAAHMHHDKIPKTVHFGQLVAIAEACMRYQCHAPLLLAVEHLWLPQWQQQQQQQQRALMTAATSDGLLLVSFAFGLARDFARLTRNAILGVADRAALQDKPWPRKIKDRIWDVREAKVEEVYAECRRTLNELTAATARSHPRPSDLVLAGGGGGGRRRRPGCCCCCRAQGDSGAACSAANLGCFMARLGELDLLRQIVPSLDHLRMPPPRRSLLQLIDALRSTEGPTGAPPHGQGDGGGGACASCCDFAPAFRRAVGDIARGVEGLTFLEVAGRRGWALSKNRHHRHRLEAEEVFFRVRDVDDGPPPPPLPSPPSLTGTGDYSTRDDGGGGGAGGYGCYGHDNSEQHEAVRLRILSLLDDVRDLRAAALVSTALHATYLRNRATLEEAAAAAGSQQRPGRRRRRRHEEEERSPGRTFFLTVGEDEEEEDEEEEEEVEEESMRIGNPNRASWSGSGSGSGSASGPTMPPRGSPGGRGRLARVVSSPPGYAAAAAAADAAAGRPDTDPDLAVAMAMAEDKAILRENDKFLRDPHHPVLPAAWAARPAT
ncbi:hypothetical protein GGR56DRAFT_674476 [Xylariaceae sp. FL0804]|nr:hypothetical protein GGR56DRAFT_674476 [Xylariaceae sp. FL0804]